MQLYFHRESQNVYQLIQNAKGVMVWCHPIPEGDQLLDLDVEKDLEWAALDPMSIDDTFMNDGKEIGSIEFEQLISSKLSERA